MKIEFNFQTNAVLKERKRLKMFLNEIFVGEKTELNFLSFVFCSDSYIIDINRNYLKHDYATDIISFRLSDADEPMIGDIYISVDSVKANAQLFSANFTQELHRVIFHGVLHLCGYGDKTEDEKKKMRSKEDFYLRGYGLL